MWWLGQMVFVAIIVFAVVVPLQYQVAFSCYIWCCCRLSTLLLPYVDAPVAATPCLDSYVGLVLDAEHTLPVWCGIGARRWNIEGTTCEKKAVWTAQPNGQSVCSRRIKVIYFDVGVDGKHLRIG